MSGGVDSSVAAALLKEEGYEAVGCFMRLGSPGESLVEGPIQPDACELDSAGAGDEGARDKRSLKIGHQGCCSINDAKDAQLVAAQLDIPFYVLNFKRDFNRIIDYFTAEYNAGRTPNPCVRCNDWLKFGKLADYARSIDAQYVATGHYARLEEVDGEPALLRGVDLGKDQSYVLFGGKRSELANTLLPIGRYHKTEIRELARQFGLNTVASKHDSQEICFVPDMDYASVVEKRTEGGFESGEIRDAEGKTIGRHEGHQRYTIGQRRGLGIAAERPLYVIDKDPATNTVTVGQRDELLAVGAEANQTNWLIDAPAIGAALECTAKIRYNAQPVPARVTRTTEKELAVAFDEPQSAVAPGQAVVCYHGERVIAGGWITRDIKS